jgi:hypothetical protein
MSTKLKYTVNVRGDGSWENIVINIPTGLTIQNRKLHRSCLNYQINGGYVYDVNNNAQVKFGTAPDTWPVRSAIRRSRDAWLKMHNELFSQNPKLKPKWHDFKMMLTASQVSSGSTETYNVPEDIFDHNLPWNAAGITWSLYTTEDGAGTPVINSNGETIGIPDTDKDEFTTHLLGAHIGTDMGGPSQQYTSVGSLTSWTNSRPVVDVYDYTNNALDRLQDDPIAMLFNDGDADNEIIDNFYQQDPDTTIQEGDAFPSYNPNTPVDTIMEQAACRTSSASPVAYFTGFPALLGQVFLRIKTSGGSGLVDIIFDVEEKGLKI